jgi:sugar phosphate isomerase/epimerase
MTWEIGISTGIAYQYPIADALDAIAAAGFRVLELSTAPHHFDYARPDAVEQVRARLEGTGLRVHSLHAPFGHDVNITSPEESIRRASFDRLERAADALRALSGSLFVIHPGGEDQRWIWDRAARLELSVEGLTRVWNTCRSRGLVLVVETPLPHLIGGQPDDFQLVLDRLPVDGTAICIDTSHVALGAGVDSCLQRFGHRLAHVQVSDNNGVYDDHLVPGEGRIAWPRFVEGLGHLRYAGVFMLEVGGCTDFGVRSRQAYDAARRLVELRSGSDSDETGHGSDPPERRRE